MQERPVSQAGATSTPTTTAPEAPKGPDILKKEETGVVTDDMSKRFAALSRQQKKLFEEQQRFKAEAQEWQEWKKAKESAKAKPLDYLKASGLSIDDIIQHTLNDGEETIEQKVKRLEEERKRELEERKAQEEARMEQERTTRESAAIDSFKGKIRDYINQDTSKYEAITALNVQDLVWDRIHAHYNETGAMLSIADAADAVENEIIEGAKKLSTLKKLGLAQEASKQTLSPGTEASTRAQTLTNTLSGSAAEVGQKKMSREDSLKAAARQLIWKD
jgi:hypothetical protein